MAVLQRSPAEARQFISRRSEYFSSMPVTGKPMKVTMRLERPNRPAITYDRFYVQTISENDADATEIMQSTDGEKIYLSEREAPPSITIGGVLYDSDVDADGRRESEHGAADWRVFYEKARASQVIRSGGRLLLDIYGETMSVLLIGTSHTHSAGGPHRFDASCSFLVMETFGSAVQLIANTGVAGRLTAEGAVRVGLLSDNASAARPGILTPQLLTSIEEQARGDLQPVDSGSFRA